MAAPLSRHGVDIRVHKADAFEYPADVLVLKYAQHLYGLDKAAVARMGGFARYPEPGGHQIVTAPRGIAARAVVVLGVPSLSDFAYEDVRIFGRRALVVVGRDLPNTREIALTLHGVGLGLEEREAFRSEIAGILEAVQTGLSGAALKRVTVVESDPRAAARLTEMLPDALLAGDAHRRSERRQPEPGKGSDDRPHAFVAMPFSTEFDDVFHYGIERPVQRAGLLCERMDRIAFSGDIVERMQRRIRSARVVVADISDGNANVYLEIGYAWAARVPTVLLCHEDGEPHFDVQGHKQLRYRSIREVEAKLTAELAVIVRP